MGTLVGSSCTCCVLGLLIPLVRLLLVSKMKKNVQCKGFQEWTYFLHPRFAFYCRPRELWFLIPSACFITLSASTEGICVQHCLLESITGHISSERSSDCRTLSLVELICFYFKISGFAATQANNVRILSTASSFRRAKAKSLGSLQFSADALQGCCLLRLNWHRLVNLTEKMQAYMEHRTAISMIFRSGPKGINRKLRWNCTFFPLCFVK